MIRVIEHGNTIEVTNPANGQKTKMTDVVFIEEGRGGADSKLANSSNLLAQAVGDDNVGFNQVRRHTQAVLITKVDLFPIGKELQLFINRGMYSVPQMRQQENVPPRLIDGKPTYFKTWIDNAPKDDVDERYDTNTLIVAKADLVFGARLQSADVRILPKEGTLVPEEAVEELGA